MSFSTNIPDIRVQACNQAPIREHGDYVLYWMIAARRTRRNFALEQAADQARDLGKPLLIFEPLRSGYRWASDRLHRFVIEGMEVNQRRCQDHGVAYYPYVEPEPGQGRGLLQALAERACSVITDDFPSFFLPRMVSSAAERLDVRLERVDSNGLLPIRATDRVFLRAVDFRRYMQKTLPSHIGDFPRLNPLSSGLPRLHSLPEDVTRRWPVADLESLLGPGDPLGALPIDHSVAPVDYSGGSEVAERNLDLFIRERLSRYVDDRRDVGRRATSELSPYLHFGHLSAHEVFAAVASWEDWNPSKLFHKATAARHGWWGLSEPAEAFLDELVTWRELGYNMCALRDDYQRYESLPEWARATLEQHSSDPRPAIYSLEEFERAATHDELWNAAQRELVRDGRIHNYLRMLWGKKILEWTASPKEALEVMIELNNKYAVDGRNPNSYSGIFWCLGRYDRAWGPERPIFGKVRFMSSDSTRRKLDAKAYIAEFSAEPRQTALAF